jgi:hypothetical protein
VRLTLQAQGAAEVAQTGGSALPAGTSPLVDGQGTALQVTENE